MIGAHASFTLSDDALRGLKQAVESTGSGLHIRLAEDPVDERQSMAQYGLSPVARLTGAGLLTPKSLVAHAVHLSWPELSNVISSGSWLVHSPRSNMNNQVGYAPAGKFGSRALLGTDGIGADMLAEAQLAHLRSREAGQPIEVLKYLANGHRLASQVFGIPIGILQEGAAADLAILDYRAPTELSAANLASHLLFGFNSRQVEAVMVDGIWRMWARKPLSVNPEVVARQAQEAAAALWPRMQKV
jgi:cytosine/adenosine deaminase-related metal-dependent hydrolase